MGQVRRALVLACVLTTAMPALGEAPPAPTKAAIDEARQRRDRGLKLYEEGAYEAALSEFQRAYDLAPTYKLLYNVALAHRQLNDFAAAIRSLERFLEEGAKDVPAKRRADVEKEIAELRARVAAVTVTASPEGAEIFLDDVSLGRAPLRGPLLVNAGKRRFTAKKDGFEATTKVVSVAGTDTVRIELELVERPRAAPEATASAPVEAPAPPAEKRSIPWIAWGATGALAAGAGITGYLALSSSKDLSSQRGQAGQTRASLDASHDKTKKLALVSDVLTVGAVVAGGVALYLTVKPPSETGASVEAGVTTNGVSVRGRF